MRACLLDATPKARGIRRIRYDVAKSLNLLLDVEVMQLQLLRAVTIALVVFVTRGIAAWSAPLSAEQAKVLESARVAALKYRQQLPDFICTQVTHRNSATATLGAMGAGMATRNPAAIPAGPDSASDVIEEQLTYVGRKENYEVLSVDGRKVKGMTHMQIQGGAISGGEFGSVLAQIFEPSSGTNFTWDRATNLHGRSVYVYGYRVPKQAGTTVTDAKTRNQAVVSFSGQVFIDPETFAVLEITSRHDMPPGFSIKGIGRTIDYAPQQIAGKEYSLPSSSVIRIEDESHIYTNKIEFRNYHRFASESTIQSIGVVPN